MSHIWSEILTTDVISDARGVAVLVILQCIDFAMGLMRAWSRKKIRSSRMRTGLTTKFGTLLLVSACAVVDPLFPLPITLMAVVAFCIYEFSSIVENAKQMGVRIPAKLDDALDDAEKQLDTHHRPEDA